MGRWVTSKGRRIYIPDEGEENPYAKKRDDIGPERRRAKEGNGKRSKTIGHDNKLDVNAAILSKRKFDKEGYYTINDGGTKRPAVYRYTDESMGKLEGIPGSEYARYIFTDPKNSHKKYYIGEDELDKNPDLITPRKRKGTRGTASKEESTKEKQIASNKAQADERNGKIRPYYVDQETQIMGEKMSSRGKMIYAKSEEEALSQYKKDYPKGNARIKESKYPEHIKKAQELNKKDALQKASEAIISKEAAEGLKKLKERKARKKKKGNK